jgi:hypothetical protein
MYVYSLICRAACTDYNDTGLGANLEAGKHILMVKCSLQAGIFFHGWTAPKYQGTMFSTTREQQTHLLRTGCEYAA